MKRRVVVTGVGVVTSLSCQVEDLWQRVLAGQSGIHVLRLFDTANYKVRFGGDVYDWDPVTTSATRNSNGSTVSRSSLLWRHGRREPLRAGLLRAKTRSVVASYWAQGSADCTRSRPRSSGSC